MRKFDLFLGIDQTGAVEKNGSPKKLNCTLIDNRKSQFKIHSQLFLNELNLDSINNLSEGALGYRPDSILICIDTAFGLPGSLKTTYQQIFQQVKKYSFNQKKFGSITAYSFFNSFSPDLKKPIRLIDKITKANSVFNLKPYQKNIGCGSYRVIKQLSQDTTWFSLWPFETPTKKIVIAEGYPSLYWKKLLGLKKRNLEMLKPHFPKLEFKTVDQADSFLLAYGALKFQNQIFAKPTSLAKREGWILGVPFE